MSRDELRSILANVMLYNRKMTASNMGVDLTNVHDIVVKIYWTFIISLYATYFMDLNERCPTNLLPLELHDNDIRTNLDAIEGNKKDVKFIEFIEKIKR